MKRRHLLANRSQQIKVCFILCFVVLGIRALIIHIIPPHSQNLKNIATDQYHKPLKLHPYRGSILDRQGNELAISVMKPSVFINPKSFDPTPKQLKLLSQYLKVSEQKISNIAGYERYFMWLRRKIDQDVYSKIKSLDIRGLYFVQEPARYYPHNQLASPLLGATGLDNSGILGLEKQYERFLSSEVEKLHVFRDAKGRSIIQKSATALPENHGHSIQLTLDLPIQTLTEKALAKGLQKAGTQKGTAIVVDPFTGKLLALASFPSFDPNQLSSINHRNSRASAFVDRFEPGSVIKPLVLGHSLNKKLITTETEVNCHNGYYKEGSWRITDTHAYEMLTAKDIIVFSSNIGAYKIAQLLSPKGLYDGLKLFGFASNTHSGNFPGQINGYITHWEKWRQVRFANISFGQGFAATALEITMAYAAIANGGMLLPLKVIDSIKRKGNSSFSKNLSDKKPQQVLTPAIARKLRLILAEVVNKGTGTNAQLANYTTAGKTGTTEKYDHKMKKYSKNLRIASFAGFAPAINPHLVIYVLVDEPSKKPYYGGIWAAPIFAEIAEGALRYLNVTPDKSPPIAGENKPLPHSTRL